MTAGLGRVMFGFGRRDDDTPEAVEREVTAAIRQEVRGARQQMALDQARRFLNPPQDGGDTVSAEAWRSANEATKSSLDLTREDLRDARATATAAAERLEAARAAGLQAGLDAGAREVAAVRSQAQTELSAMERVCGLAVDTVKSVTAAQAQAQREAAAAQLAASEQVSSFWRLTAEEMRDALLGTMRAPAAQAAAPAQSPWEALAELPKALNAIQAVTGVLQQDPRITAEAKATEERGKALGTLLGQVGNAVEKHAPAVLEMFKPAPSANPAGMTNGIPNVPPPPPA